MATLKDTFIAGVFCAQIGQRWTVQFGPRAKERRSIGGDNKSASAVLMVVLANELLTRTVKLHFLMLKVSHHISVRRTD